MLTVGTWGELLSWTTPQPKMPIAVRLNKIRIDRLFVALASKNHSPDTHTYTLSKVNQLLRLLKMYALLFKKRLHGRANPVPSGVRAGSNPDVCNRMTKQKGAVA